MHVRRTPNRCTAQPCTLLLALLAVSPVALAESNPWYVGVSQSLAHESNLYRVDDNVPLGPGFSRSDTISTTSLVGGIDQPIGRQRVYGSLNVGVNRYSGNDYLNNTSYSLSAGLDWSTIERFSGTVSLASSEQQRRFNLDTQPGVVETRQNTERVNQLDALFRVGMVTRLTMEAGVGFRQVDYSATEYASSEYQQTRASLGVRYRPGIATFGVGFSRSDTDYDSRNAAGATERVNRDSLDFSVNWPASGTSSVYARLSPTRVTYEQFTERDFSGLTGALRWTWRPTGKLNFVTQLLHDIGQDSNFETFGTGVVFGTTNTGRTTTDLKLTGNYELTAKIALTANLGVSHRSLEQTTPPPFPAVISGSDDTTTLGLGARWAPLRSVLVGCNIGHDQRSAKGGLTQDYSGNSFSCFGQFTLQ